MLSNALVFLHFDYCSPDRSTCKAGFSNSLQILQNKLACVRLSADIRTFIDDLMTTLNRDKLDKRCQKQLLLTVFKCLKHDAPSYLSSKFVYTSSVHSQNTRSQSSNTLVMPSFNIKPGKCTFLEVVQLAFQLMSDVICLLWTYTLSNLMFSFRLCVCYVSACLKSVL